MLEMKKKITFLVICAIIGTIVFSQNIDSLKVFLTKYQKVIFVTPDSEYKFTRFIAPNGKFYFKEGFVLVVVHTDKSLDKIPIKPRLVLNL